MSTLFISHSSQDDGFVRELRAALADYGQEGWIDSRELRGGDPLWSEIQEAINGASAFAVVVSTDALQSDWVADEVAHAIKLRKKRGTKQYLVIPLSLNGTKPGALGKLFGKQLKFIPVNSDAGGVEVAMNAILVAVGKRLPSDVAPTPQPKAEPLEELVLELTDLKFPNMRASVVPLLAPSSCMNRPRQANRTFTARKSGDLPHPPDQSRLGN